MERLSCLALKGVHPRPEDAGHALRSPVACAQVLAQTERALLPLPTVSAISRQHPERETHWRVI